VKLSWLENDYSFLHAYFLFGGGAVLTSKVGQTRALSRSCHDAAAAKFVAPPPPTLADRRAVTAAADILGRLSARCGACGQLVIHRGEYS